MSQAVLKSVCLPHSFYFSVGVWARRAHASHLPGCCKLVLDCGNPGGQWPSPEEIISVRDSVLLMTHLSWLGFCLRFWKSFQQGSVGSLDIPREDVGRFEVQRWREQPFKGLVRLGLVRGDMEHSHWGSTIWGHEELFSTHHGYWLHRHKEAFPELSQ